MKELRVKYDFKYPEVKLIKLALKVGLILLLDEHGYPTLKGDEVYKDILE